YLLEILEKRDLLGADLNYRLLAIDALGKIGDPSAIDTLKKLYSSKYPFYKDAVAEGLRLEIIKSLNNYPPAQVRPFFELAAATSKNEKIKALCQELLIRSRNA
ncbi:MAG TPA: HEAT repeat domain-containing protein, partial [Thermodesulfovibrionia bacterium]|nr:HEAT repeat domain-containing protein [Thermodesulfovibrionia bacterium]